MLHRIAATATRNAACVAALAVSLGILPLFLLPSEALAQGTGQAPAQGGAPGMQFGGAAQPPAAQAPGGEPFETKQFQDWTVRCGKRAPDQPEACEMVQQPQDDKGQTVLLVAIGKVANSDKPGMLIILPLGIALPPGVVLKVDGGQEVPAQFARCEHHGCEVEMLLEPNVLSLLKAGQKANVLFQIRDQNGQPKVVGVPFSLLGFTAALNEVMA